VSDCVSHLKDVSLFRNLTEEQLASLEPSLELVEGHPGRMLFRQGDPSDCFYVIVSGKVSVVIEGDSGEETYRDLGAGDFFGEIGMLRGSKRTADALVAVQSELIKVDKHGFDTMMSADLRFADIVMEVTRERLAELRQADVHLDYERSEDDAARVGVFFSARGGAGTTILATNFAKKIADLSKKRVCLLDADLEFGACHILLNVPNKNIVIDGLEGDEIDPLDIQDTVVKTGLGFDLYPCPARTEDAMRYTPGQLRSIMAELQRAYDYIIVDTRSTLSDATLTMLECADDVFCVMENDIISISRTIRTLDLLVRAGFETNRFRIVVNKLSSFGYGLAEMERDMKREILFRVEVDVKPVLDSVNAGKLLVVERSRSMAAVNIANGAREYLLPFGDVSVKDAEVLSAEKEERGFSLWKLFGRG
jgi:MinD-like ATPase involved in chromosome partitioning or flagellar assembly